MMRTNRYQDNDGQQRAACLLLLAVIAGTAVAAEHDSVLAEQRWRENGFGLSLRPPAGAAKVEHTLDGAEVKFVAADGSAISLFMRHSDQPIDLDTIKQGVKVELPFAVRLAGMLREEQIRPAGRPGFRIYFQVEDKDHGDWVIGHACMQIDPFSFALLQFDCGLDQFNHKRKVFEAVVDSLDLMDPKELDRLRTVQVEAGMAWRAGIGLQQLKDVMTDEQWLRIKEQDRDIGYMRIRQREDPDAASSGIEIHVQTHLKEAAEEFDSESTFFASHDRSMEFWETWTTQRPGDRPFPLPQGAPQVDTKTWRQTGVRSDRSIEVRQQTPSRIRKLPWLLPEKIYPNAYLSQVDLHLLPCLFPREQEVDMAFYAFFPNGQKVALRTYRVVPLADGGYRVHTRPAPNQAEQVATYDALGRLRQKKMADGRLLVHTTPQELKAIWNIR